MPKECYHICRRIEFGLLTALSLATPVVVLLIFTFSSAEAKAGRIGQEASSHALSGSSHIAQKSTLQSFIGPTDVYTNSWTNLFPVLHDVSAVSATEAWASGEYGHLAHYTNSSWTAVDPAALHGYDLSDIEMRTATDGWVTGETKAFHYDGTEWRDQSNGLEGVSWISGVAPVGAGDVWGIGGDSLLHWDGTLWHRASPVLTETVNLVDITMRSPTDGWAVGSDYNPNGSDAGILLHYDGTAWTRVPEPPGVESFERVATGHTGEAWLIANEGYGANWLYRYDNGSWSVWLSDFDYGADLIAVFMQNDTLGWASTSWGSILYWNGTEWTMDHQGEGPAATIQGLSGVTNQVWAVGGNDLILIRGDGKSNANKGGGDIPSVAWVNEQGGPTTQDLNAVSAVSSDEAWAVGGAGTFLHYMDGNWQLVSSPVTATLWDVQMLSATEGYAVGTAGDESGEGIIARWDGSIWGEVERTPEGLSSVGMVGSGEGWAVGAFGSIWHASGGVWTSVSSPVDWPLRVVAMDSPQHGWIGGEGVLLEYTGNAWIDRTPSLPDGAPEIEDITLAADGREGWAVGFANTYPAEHAILHLRDGTWELDPVETYGYLEAVSMDALGEVWTLGCLAAYRHTGGMWLPEDLPASGPCLSGLAIVPGRVGWAVASGGTIMRYYPLGPGQRYFDVPTTSPFYQYIECMASRGEISGYADNTFRPGGDVTRGQLSKIVSNSAGFNEDPGPQLFYDVPPGSAFYDWVQRLANRGYISGYPCGGAGEPCGQNNLPYFRPNSTSTRGQISKVVSSAAGYTDIPPGQSFEDVPPSNPFYLWIERLAGRGIMGGYLCGGEGEPCGSGNKPYFRWGNNATRGQTSKIVANTFFPSCQSP